MSTQVQFRRGTTTQNNAFTGAAGEISVDTDLKTIRLHDGTTAGGGATMLNNISSQTALNKTFSTGSAWQGNAIGLAYGGTGSSLTATAGAVAYSGASGLALSAAGTSGQILTSGGSGAPTWVAASSISAGTSTLATTATNIAGGSAGQLVIQSDTNLSTFITAGAAGTFLQSAGAGYAPTWAAGQVTLGSTAVALGSTVTSFSGIANIIMSNGSYGGGTITGLGISGTGPWTVTVTGMSSTAGLGVGQNITASAGTGALFNGTPTSVVIASIVSSTSITVTVTGGTTPTSGTITGITVFGYLQVPVGTNAQRPYSPATGMIRYNSDTVSFEGYSSSAWSSLGGVSSVDKYTYIRAETSAGASNGELEFFAKNAAGTAAVKVAGMNYSRFLEVTGTVLGTQTTQTLYNTVATTVNAFGAATAITLGNATSATLTLNPGTLVGSNTTQTVFDTTATTVNAFGAATTLTLGNATSATVTIRPGTVVGSNTTQNLYNTTATTLNIGGAATTLALGASTGTATIANPTVVGVGTTQNLWNTTATTVNFAGAATTLNIGANSGTLTLNNPTIVGTQTTQNIFNTVATTVNAFGAATTLTLGNATSATLTLRPGTVVGSNTTQTLYNTVATTVNAFGAATAITLGNTTSATLTLNPGTIVGANTTQNLFNTVATTLNIGGAATTLALGASTGTATIANPTVTLTNATALNINGVSPVIASTSTGTLTLFNTALTTVNAFGAATTLNIGNSSGSTTLSGNLTVTGNITIQGSTETVSSANTTYSDSLLELHYTNGGTLTSDDGRDIGLRMHYYKGSDKNAALVLSNDESQMEFYVNGTETSGVFSGTYGYYKAAGFNYKDIATEESFTGTTSSTTPTAIYTFPTATWRSAELTMQITNGTNYRICKFLLIHDGTNVTLSENYLVGNDISTGSTATSFTSSISAGTLTLYATAASGTSVVKGKSTLIRV